MGDPLDEVGAGEHAPHANESYIADAKVYVTAPEQHPYRVEFLRFELDSPLPEEVRTTPHAAFLVDDLEAALEGEEVLIAPFDATAELRCAFIVDGPAVIELMERK